MSKVFELGTVRVEPGAKKSGWLHVADTWRGPIQIPLSVAHGIEPGQTIYIQAGIHGDEYEGVDAIFRLMEELNPARLRGTVIAVPVANVLAFDGIQRVSPMDYLNLNRIFPGRDSAYATERIAHLIAEEILTCELDYAIDLHGGGMGYFFAPMASFRSSDSVGFEMAKAFGLDLLWRDTIHLPHTFRAECVDRGIPILVVEMGGEGRRRETMVQQELVGLKNVLKRFGFLEGDPTSLPERMTVIEGYFMHSPAGGFLRTEVEVGDTVQRGDCIGAILDLLGQPIVTIEALSDGLVAALRTIPRINPGDWSIWVSETTEIVP